MKILMTWEMDSDPIHLHHLRLIAHALRAKHPFCHIVLACTQALVASDMTGFDDVFVTSRIQFKHSNEATGVLANLSSLGWTAPDLRPMAFGAWSQLFREIKPDFIVAEASPGALLSAVLEGIPVIQSGNGQYQVTQDELVLNEHFPEFQAWLWRITGKTYAQLLSKPGLIFAPRSVDVARPGMVFNVNPSQWPHNEQTLEHPDALIYDSHERFSGVHHLLAESGLSSFRLDPGVAIGLDKVRLVIGAYDRFSVSLAAAVGALYMGTSLPVKDALWAERCQAKKLAYPIGDLDSLGVMLQGIKRGVKKEGEFLDLDVAISYLLPS